VRAEITGSGDELVITLNADELPVQASDASLRVTLPASAGSIADGVLEMTGQPPVPGEPRTVRTVHVRLTAA
jgi:hypothetical protein